MNVFKVIILSASLMACSTTEQVQDRDVEAESDSTVATETTTTKLSNHPTTQATAWVQNSAEYKALAMQAYSSAMRILPLPLQDSYWTASLEQKNTTFSSLPPAIILDVDETVLDNSPFQARMIKLNSNYNNEAWNKWAKEAKAEAVPGAVEFTNYAANQGVAIFYITNREHQVEDATRKNLIAEGFPVSDSLDNILTKGERPEWTSSKIERRKFVEQNYRVIMIFGDDLNDFVSAKNISEEERDSLVSDNAKYLSRRWFFLPNPVYGSWDQAMYGFQIDLDETEKENVLLQHLDTKED